MYHPTDAERAVWENAEGLTGVDIATPMNKIRSRKQFFEEILGHVRWALGQAEDAERIISHDVSQMYDP